MATPLVPNHSNPAHVDAVAFHATAEFLGELCLRGLQDTNDAFGLAVEHSSRKTRAIIHDDTKSLRARIKLMDAENKRETFFRHFGPAQHLAASTVQTYATLDTVLGRAVRLLSQHAAIPAPPENPRGASIKITLPHLQKALPDLIPLTPREQEVLTQFSTIRNILIHQGYFIDESDKRIVELRASDDHGDYYELNRGFPILLRDYGVRIFVTVSKDLIVRVGDAVYRRLLSTPPPP